MKILLYTNILSPYRKHFFDALSKECKSRNIVFKVLVMAESESNRQWRYDDYKNDYTELLMSYSVKIKHAFIHYNPELKKAIKSFDPDILICSGSYFCPGTWCALKYVNRCTTFFWSESHLGETRKYGLFKNKVRDSIRHSFYRKYDGFLYAGKLSRELIEKYSKKDCKLIYVPNLIDEMVFAQAYQNPGRLIIKEKYGLLDKKRTMIIPARLEKEKGISEFLGLLSKCNNKDDVSVIVAGDGSLKGELEKKAKEYKIDVTFLGHKNQSEIVELYSAADIFALPSLSDANPLTTIEALWAGLPLVVSRHVGNHYENVREGVNGYVIDYDDEADSIKKLETIISSDDQWINSAMHTSRKIAEEIYCTVSNASRIVDELILTIT